MVGADDPLHHGGVEGPSFAVGQAAAAEDGGDLGAGVVVRQLVDLGDGAGLGLPDFPGRLGDWQGEGAVLAAGQAGVRGDGVAGAGDGDVGEQQPGDALALAHRGGGVVPDAGQVSDELADPVLPGGCEGAVVLLAGLVAGGLGVVEGAQRGVPAGFEGVGDEPAGGADGQVAAAGQVGVVAGALDVRGAQGAGLGGAVFQLGGDGEGGFDGERGEGAGEQLPDLLVESGAGDGLADPVGMFDAVALAYVGGDLLVAALVVADGHALPAGPADDDALQQRGAFAGRPGGPVPAVRGGVGGQPGAVGVVLVQGEVSGMSGGDEGDPFPAGQRGAGPLPARLLDVAGPPEGERAGVAGVVQDPQHDVVGQRLPVELALAGSRPVPPGEGQARGIERLHARGR